MNEENKASEGIKKELQRIIWREKMLSFREGIAWLVEQAQNKVKEKNIGPHRQDAPAIPEELL